MSLKEKQIIPAALVEIYKVGIIKTEDLIKKVSDSFTLDARDTTTLANRNDEKYTQIIRNLKSHKTLSKLGLANEVPGGFEITAKGKKWVEDGGLI